MSKKLYTRTGDEGRTRDMQGRSVSKSDSGIEAVGCIDELAAHIGLSLSRAASPDQQDVREALEAVQAQLSALCVVVGGGGLSLDESTMAQMEQLIDDACAKLPQLTAFILPGGCELACHLNVARTVCRRAERAVVAHGETGASIPPIALQYLNRLGDLLFTLARLANLNAGDSPACPPLSG